MKKGGKGWGPLFGCGVVGWLMWPYLSSHLERGRMGKTREGRGESNGKRDAYPSSVLKRIRDGARQYRRMSETSHSERREKDSKHNHKKSINQTKKRKLENIIKVRDRNPILLQKRHREGKKKFVERLKDPPAHI